MEIIQVILKSLKILLTPEQDIKTIIPVQGEVEGINRASIQMFLSNIPHPDIAEGTSMACPHSHTPVRHVKLVFVIINIYFWVILLQHLVDCVSSWVG